jgi:hypothetical protein
MRWQSSSARHARSQKCCPTRLDGKRFGFTKPWVCLAGARAAAATISPISPANAITPFGASEISQEQCRGIEPCITDPRILNGCDLLGARQCSPDRNHGGAVARQLISCRSNVEATVGAALLDGEKFDWHTPVFPPGKAKTDFLSAVLLRMRQLGQADFVGLSISKESGSE